MYHCSLSLWSDKVFHAVLCRVATQLCRCVVDPKAVADYFDFGRPFQVTAGVLVGYLCVVHVITYLAMVLSARKEKR